MSVSFRPQNVIASGGGGTVIKIDIVHKNTRGEDISVREAVAKVVRTYNEGENEMKILKIVGSAENKYVIEFIGNMPCQHICMNGIIQFIRQNTSAKRDKDLQFKFPQLLMLEYVNTIPYNQYLQGGDTLYKLKFIIRNILDGLKYIHSKGVVHNDIKPRNVLLDANGGTKITDFGNSFLIGDTKRLEDIGVGTIVYAPPEMISLHSDGEMTLLHNDIDPSYPIQPLVDIWSLGIMIVKIITNALPFENVTNITKIAMNIITKDPFTFYTKKTLEKIRAVSDELYDFIFYGCLVINTNPKKLPCRCSAKDLLHSNFLKC